MKEKITTYQLLAMMILLPYSTADLYFIAPETKRAVWIALLFYSIISIIIQLTYLSMFYKYPEDSIVTYLPKVYGKYIGFVLSLVYILYFFYIASRDLRDFTELLTLAALPNVSAIVIGIVFMITITYGVYKGIENVSSMMQFALIMFIILKFTIIALLALSDNVFDYTRIFPIFTENPAATILSGWRLITFPYGEYIAFTMLYPFVLQKSKLRKSVYFATIIEAVMLMINNVVFILALGYDFAALANYPLLRTYRLIHIGDFLNRLEILFLLIMIWNGFFKIVILMYCSVLGFSQVFKVKYWGLLCIISGSAILVTSQLIARNYPEHIKVGLNTVVKYVHLPIQIFIPVVTLIVYYIKNYLFKGYNNSE